MNGASKQERRSIKTRTAEHQNRNDGASKQERRSIKTGTTEHQNSNDGASKLVRRSILIANLPVELPENRDDFGTTILNYV